MSFSSTVKNEIANKPITKDCCKDALLQAFYQSFDADAYKKADVKKNCCKRAFLRGIFLNFGMVMDPEKVYQLEINCTHEKLADFIIKLMEASSINGKKIERRGHFVVYLKDGDEIANFLALIQADISLLNLENVRVVKDVRNNVNRQVNCETANLQKSVAAALSQVDEIQWLDEHIGIDNLPDSLREIARVRLNHPDASLQELGEYLDPPVGKSGVNHRLRKLKKYFEEESL